MTRKHRVEGLLGTVVEVGLVDAPRLRARGIEQEALAGARRLQSVFSRFDATSELSQMRRHGTTTNPDLQAVVDLAALWWERTSGAFHPGTEPLRQIWHDAANRSVAPDRERLGAIAADLVPQPQHLDLNAIAKGWIADRTLEVLMSVRPAGAWISAGGDITHRGNEPMTVGIENPLRPFDNAAPVATVKLRNAALATSGAARRHWQIDGKRYSHVLDPRTGWPVDHVASASVIAPDGATADVLATAATVLIVDDAIRLIESIEGTACLLVMVDGDVVRSSRWPESPSERRVTTLQSR